MPINPTVSAAFITLAYDAGAQTYTVTEGSSSQAFGPSNLVSSVGGLNTYEISAGTTVERLVLRTGGDSLFDRADRKYAAIGRWLSLTNNGTGGNYATRSFAYGFPTAVGGVPTVGKASYAVNILGSRSTVSEPHLLALSGFGQLLVDFSAGNLNLYSSLLSQSADGGAVNVLNALGLLKGTASITAGANGFAGTMTADFRDGGERYTGTLSGLFYGPSGAEVGGTGRGDIGGGPTIDFAFVGTRVADVTSSDVIASLTRPTGFYGSGVIDLASATANRAVAGAVPVAISAVTFDPVSQTYTLAVANGALAGRRDTLIFSAADRALADDITDFTAYSKTSADGTHRLRVFDGATAGVTLTYASFVELLTTQRDGGGSVTDNILEYYTIGSPTPLHQVPTTGTASYAGALIGQARGTTGLFLYPVGGTSSLSVNFGDGTFLARIAPVRSDGVGGSVGSGTYTWNGNISSITGGFGGTSMTNTSHRGTFAGMFYGPAAQEFAAAFSVYDNAVAIAIDGIAFGTQSPAP